MWGSIIKAQRARQGVHCLCERHRPAGIECASRRGQPPGGGRKLETWPQGRKAQASARSTDGKSKKKKVKTKGKRPVASVVLKCTVSYCA